MGFSSWWPYHSNDSAIKTLDVQAQTICNKLLQSDNNDVTQNIIEKEMVKIPLLYQPGNGFRKSHGME